jgi:AraC-like DNA-binding protein
MEQFRKYYDDDQVKVLAENQPDWGVAVRTVGHYVHQPKAIYPDPGHPGSYYFDWKKGRVLNEFQLLFVSNGQGIFEADGVKETVIKAGTVFLLFPGVWHRYRPSAETGWEEFWVGFNGHYADYLMQQNCFKKASPFVHVGSHAELMNVFIQLIDTVKYEGTGYYQLSSCLITQLLALVYSSAIMTDVQRQNKNKFVHIARYKMHENFSVSLDMEEMARDLNVSYTWFRKAFKETMGIAPNQYHLNIRIEKACKLLKETDLTVTEIAYNLGFESEFYFSRIFKKKTGVAPGRFRVK